MRAHELEQQRGEAQRVPLGCEHDSDHTHTRGNARLGAVLVPPASLGKKTHNSGGGVLRRVLPQEWEIIGSMLNTTRDPLRK